MATPLRVKKFQNPTFTETEWTNKNPYLQHGQVGYEINTSTQKVERYKVGPGDWNNLPYQEGMYPYPDIPTNPIGDANFNMVDYTNSEVLNLMLNPYIGAALSNVLNNADGNFSNVQVFEVGQGISGPVAVTFTVSNPDTLVGGTPINVTAGGVFNNEGDFANGQVDLTLASALNPLSTTYVTISLIATHQEGTSNTVTTKINFYPQVFVGVSPNADLTEAQAGNIPFKNQKITDDYKQTYTFGSAGYLWVFIPTMMNPVNVEFYDESVGALPGSTIGMEDKGPMVIDNDTTTYADGYQAFRSTFFITENLTLMRLA